MKERLGVCPKSEQVSLKSAQNHSVTYTNAVLLPNGTKTITATINSEERSSSEV